MCIAHHFFAICIFVLTGCAEDMPVTARYAPGECPPTIDKDEGTAAEVPPARPDAGDGDAGAADARGDEPEASEPTSVGTGRIELNSATAAALDTLPGVGPALAARIISYRAKRPFERPEDLLRVRGIGPAKFAKMKDEVRVQKRRP